MRLIKILIMIILQGFLFCSCHHSPKKQVKISSQDTIPMSNLKWKNKIHDFGDVQQDSILTARYTFYNTGDNDLVILFINPDCNCTSYKLSKNNIHTNDSAYVELKLSTKNKIGRQHLYTTVKANTEAQMYKLIFKANVKHH